MIKIINVNNHKSVAISNGELYLDGIRYDKHDNVDTVFISDGTTGTYEDMIKTIDSIYESVFTNKY